MRATSATNSAHPHSGTTIPPRPTLGQLRSVQPSALITAPSAKSITVAAAGTVDSANPQLTHDQACRPRPLSACAGSAVLWRMVLFPAGQAFGTPAGNVVLEYFVASR